MMSELGRETVSAYAAAKGGLKMLTRNIASEFGEYNIQCNGIGPGYIETRRPRRCAHRSTRSTALLFQKRRLPLGHHDDLKGPPYFWLPALPIL